MYLYKILFFTFIIVSIISGQNNDWPTLADSPWPMIKHDPQFTGHSPCKGPQMPTIVWAKDMPDGIFSGPVIGEEGNLYFGSYYQLDSADHFYSYTPNGDFIWDYKLGTNRPPQSGILIDSSNTIYFGSLDQYFYALNPDGTLKWKFETSNPIVELAIPNIDMQGRLYITNGLGELYSINNNGTLNWKVKYNEGFFNQSPVFSPDGNTIYIAGKDSNLFAMDLESNIKWQFSCGHISAPPTIDLNGNLLFIPNQEPFELFSLYPDGSLKWSFLMRNESPFDIKSNTTIDDSGNIYFVNVDTVITSKFTLTSLDRNGTFRWKYYFDVGEEIWQSLICDSDGLIYCGSTKGNYYYAITSSGELKWKLPLNGYQVDNTGAIAEDGTLYLGVHLTSIESNQKQTLLAIRDTNTTSISYYKSLPFEFRLNQNYPNPFNPETKISFSIPRNGKVSLKIYNILGEEVKTLVNDFRYRGEYFEIFDAIDLASGVYIYRLQCGNYVSTKKMLLVR